MQNAANKKWSVQLKAQIVAFFIPLGVYLLTAARTVTFEDSGLFILSGYYWGLPHPPGYPLYSFVAHLFSYLPVGSVAFRIGLFSVLLGAGSSLLIYRFLNRFTSHTRVSLLTALVISFASTYWGQMIIAEVYALNVFLSLLFFDVLMKIRERDNVTSRQFFVLGSVGALALSNHWPIFVITGPFYLFFIERSWVKKKNVLSFVGGLALVILPYLLMWWRSLQGPEVSFLGEIQSLKDWIKYIARSYYSTTDVSVLHSYKDVLAFYADFIKRIAYKDFVFLVTPLALIGLWSEFQSKNRKLFYAFFYLMCTTSFLLPLRLKLEFNILNQNVFSVFWLMPFVAYGYFVAMGALWVENKRRLVGVALLLMAVAAQVMVNYSENNLRRDHFAEDYARVVLNNVPANSHLVTSTDSDVGPISYTNMILKVNEGLKLYTGSGVFFKNRLVDPLAPGVQRRFQRTVDFIKANAPVYSVKNINIFDGRKELPVSSIFNGVVYKYTNYPEPKEPISDEVLNLTKQALEHYVEGLELANWPYHRGTLAARLCNILVLKGVEDHIVFEKAPVCQQVLARHMVATGRRERADELFMGWIRKYKDPIVSEKQQYTYHFMINRLELINSLTSDPPRQQRLIAEFLPIVEQVIFDYPLCDNMVYPVLESIKEQIKLSDRALNQLKVFEKCKKEPLKKAN
jgi:hypothetical protein